MIALLFDMDDTLYDQMQPFSSAYKAVFGQQQYDVKLEDLFAKNSFYSNEVFEKVTAGEITEQEMHIYRISQAFASFGIEITPEQALQFQDSYSNYQKQIVVHPQMKELLDFAKSNPEIRLGVITNGPAEHQGRKIRLLKMDRWINTEATFISGQVGIAKPKTGIFRHVEEKLQITPDQAYYLGDSYEKDIVGAKQAGWHSIWVNRHHVTLAPDAQFAPDYIMDDEHTPLDVVQKILTERASDKPKA